MARHIRLFLSVALALGLVSCASRSDDPRVITFWITFADPITQGAFQKIVDGFESEHPGYRVQMTVKPSLGTGDATSLITAVRGQTGPDVYLMNRPTVAQYAALGLLEELDDYVPTDMPAKYIDFGWRESSYKGHQYALPMDTDSRGLFYNKKMLRDAGVDPSVLDPAHGPPTVDEVMTIAAKLDKQNADGAYSEIGFMPWSGQGFWATWAYAYGAKLFDNDTCSVTLTEPALHETFEQLEQWATQLNYEKTNTFLATYQPPGSPPEASVFYASRLGMTIDGNWALANLRQFAPNLDYGVTYLPVPRKGDPPFTWSGGFALAMPRGAANPDGGWKFMEYAAGPAGQRVYTKDTSHLPTYEALLSDQKLIGDQQFFVDALKFSTSLPPVPVMAELLDAMQQAQDSVLLGTATPDEALERAEDRVQPSMEQYCPFTMP